MTNPLEIPDFVEPISSFLTSKELAAIKPVSRVMKECAEYALSQRITPVKEIWEAAPLEIHSPEDSNARISVLRTLMKTDMFFLLTRGQMDDLFRENRPTLDEIHLALKMRFSWEVAFREEDYYPLESRAYRAVPASLFQSLPECRECFLRDLEGTKSRPEGFLRPQEGKSPYLELQWEAFFKNKGREAAIIIARRDHWRNERSSFYSDYGHHGITPGEARCIANAAKRVKSLQKVTIEECLSDEAFEELKKSGKEIDARRTIRPVSDLRRKVCRDSRPLLTFIGYVIAIALCIHVGIIMVAAHCCGFWVMLACIGLFMIPGLLIETPDFLWNRYEEIRSWICRHHVPPPPAPPLPQIAAGLDDVE